MKMKHGIIAIATILGGASPLWADSQNGNIVLMGRGTASSAPETVSFSVTVTSICYDSSQAAAAANAKMANEAIKVLESFKKSERDRVTATGGANYRQTETTQVGSESKVLCELKWRAENHLKIEIAEIDDLPDLQDSLMHAVANAAAPDQALPAQTVVELSRPTFGMYPETAKALRDKAQGLAFADGRSQMQAYLSQCSFVDPRLVSITPPEYDYVYRRAGVRAEPSYESAPVIPDELEVNATIRMEWAFTPSSACRN